MAPTELEPTACLSLDLRILSAGPLWLEREDRAMNRRPLDLHSLRHSCCLQTSSSDSLVTGQYHGWETDVATPLGARFTTDRVVRTFIPSFCCYARSESDAYVHILPRPNQPLSISDVNVVELDRTFFQSFLPQQQLLPPPPASFLAVSIRYVPIIVGSLSEASHHMIPNGFKLDITNVRGTLCSFPPAPLSSPQVHLTLKFS